MKRETSREKLAKWLAEWKLDQALPCAADEPLSTAGSPSRGTALSIGRTGGELQEGDVVLLPPCGPFTAARPVYVALARRIGEEQWEVVPFSRFPVPATEGEWSTGRDAEPLKVLCPWNRGRLDAALLLGGWKAGRLTGRERELLRESLGGTIGEALRERRGAPLVHPLDPRHDYLEEERAIWFDGEPGAYTRSPWAGNSVPNAAEKTKDGYE